MSRQIRLVSILWLEVAFILSATSAGHAANCPPNTEQYATTQDGNTVTVHCQCIAGFALVDGECKVAIVPSLAADPSAARLSTAQLRAVDARIAQLRKAIAVLSDTAAEWARERQHLTADMDNDATALSWECVNLLTLGLAEWNELLAHGNMSDLELNTIEKEYWGTFKDLPKDASLLEKAVGATNNPALTTAILTYSKRLKDLELERPVRLAGVISRFQDAGEALSAAIELASKPISASADPALFDALYRSSATLGRLAVVFAEGTGASAAVMGSASSSVIIAGRLMDSIWDERKRFADLAQHSSDRAAVRRSLMSKLNNAEQERKTLEWAVNRAR